MAYSSRAIRSRAITHALRRPDIFNEHAVGEHAGWTGNDASYVWTNDCEYTY
jgi:hypothetical protein